MNEIGGAFGHVLGQTSSLSRSAVVVTVRSTADRHCELRTRHVLRVSLLWVAMSALCYATRILLDSHRPSSPGTGVCQHTTPHRRTPIRQIGKGSSQQL